MPDLHKLGELASTSPAFRRILKSLRDGQETRGVVMEAARPYIIATLAARLDGPVLLVTAQPEQSARMAGNIPDWLSGRPVMIFPETHALPYERLATDTSIEMERLRVLESLQGEKPLVVTSMAGLLSRTTAREDLLAARCRVRLGMDVPPLQLLKQLDALGYRRENIVEVPGVMSHRGGIIDVWPATSDTPVRLEFFGDTIDSLRTFDPATQRSQSVIGDIEAGPATELLALRRLGERDIGKKLDGLDLSRCTAEVRQQLEEDFAVLLQGQVPREVHQLAPLFLGGCLFDYLPKGSAVIFEEAEAIEQAARSIEEEAVQIREEKEARGEMPANLPSPYFSWEEVLPKRRQFAGFQLDAWGTENVLDFTTAPSFLGKVPAFLKKTIELAGEGKRVVIVSHQADRLAELYDEEDIIITPVEAVTDVPASGGLVVVKGSQPEGWVMDGETCFFTDTEIFGFVKQRRQVKKRPVPKHRLMVDLIPDDYIVHVEHGIGRFEGVRTMKSAGTDKEFLVIRYAAGDMLYVPTDQIDRVNRYIGSGDKPPVLNRLGTQEWMRTKQKAKEAADLLAEELIELYAAREVVEGHAYSQDTVWQQEMEAAFPYVETPDQVRAIADIKDDMERERPMDRLVCGDVGYGKTEVAIRAAFKAVMEGRQVAVLVPTTVLAQQHYETFSERLEAFPSRVEVLSRFRSPAQQKATLDGLADGSVDICIGTHRLLQKDVHIKNLGLLIIDEEQRFGVGHKEHFKKLRQEVDVLTLSATPIPRTLHMSLVGVRDMSTMETPPEERLPVKTYVAEFNDHLVREAILRELDRNGQVFFVHNRVQSIRLVAEHIMELVPEARVGIGHGQMHEDDLEKVITAFSRRELDVLVSTTIIESGLDMPNANTLIVNRADKFGLTQLYQLRGRVGRGGNLAYAYFLYDKGRRLTPVAQRRLRTIYEATELGAGFTIAMKDLEIRGAGNLLGHRQSGHITAVGFALYTKILADAVETKKALNEGRPRPQPELPAPSVDLPLDAYIPENYVPDVETRLELYRRLVETGGAERLDDLLKELGDRFGEPPREVDNLFFAVKIRGLGAKAGIESVGVEEGQIVIRRFTGLPFDRAKFFSILRDGITVGRTQVRLDYRKIGGEWRAVLEAVVKGLLT